MTGWMTRRLKSRANSAASSVPAKHRSASRIFRRESVSSTLRRLRDELHREAAGRRDRQHAQVDVAGADVAPQLVGCRPDCNGAVQAVDRHDEVALAA